MDKLFVCVIKDGEQIKEVYIVGSLIPGSPVEVERCMGERRILRRSLEMGERYVFLVTLHSLF